MKHQKKSLKETNQRSLKNPGREHQIEDDQGYSNVDLQEEDETGTNNFTSLEQEYIYWHTKLGHLSKTRMQQ
jgi:hypothetical protein